MLIFHLDLAKPSLIRYNFGILVKTRQSEIIRNTTFVF